MKKIIWAHVFCMCLFSSNTFSKLLKYDVYQVAKKEYSFEEVCKTILNKTYPLIEKHSSTKVDCMSQIVEVANFCKKKLPKDPYLIRGVIENSKVFCQSAKRVILKYQCLSDDLCKDSHRGCLVLKNTLAIRLNIQHHSVLSKNILNCYYEI